MLSGILDCSGRGVIKCRQAKSRASSLDVESLKIFTLLMNIDTPDRSIEGPVKEHQINRVYPMPFI